MERHKCKLCSRTFANGRALGGHMKAHLATLPLPPKPQQQPPLSDGVHSFSSSYSSSESEEDEQDEESLAAVEQRETEEKSLIANYGLRENPKKSFRLADPEFSFPATDTCGSVVVQDRESETESKNPTRRRSKRARKSIVMSHARNITMEEQPNNNKKKPKLSFMESPEPAEPVSSVSNTSSEEDVAMCLMMLSRDRWTRKSVLVVKEEDQEIKLMKKRARGKHQCEKCGKKFRSSGALGSHKSICFTNEADANDKVFECPYCSKVFGSGQALGGHKRSHLIPSSTSNAANISHSARLNPKENLFIDLNLPAPPEEDDLSVVSDA